MRGDFAKVIVLFVGLIGCQNPKTVEPLEILELTIIDIHKGYEDGRFNSERVTKAYLERISEFDHEINSITTINNEAIARAKELDLEYKETGK